MTCYRIVHIERKSPSGLYGTHSAFLIDRFPRRFFKTRATIITTVTAITMLRSMTTAPTIPPMMAALLEELCELVEDVVSHSPSLRDEIATEQSESTVISTSFTMILAPPLIPYQRDEGATVSLRGTLQSGTLCHIGRGLRVTGKWLCLSINDVTGNATITTGGSQLFHYCTSDILQLLFCWSDLKITVA